MTDESADLLLDRVADGHDAAPRSIALTNSKTAATAIALAATLGPAAAGWVVYLGVWTLVGLAVHALYRPHGTVAAGAITIAAGVYELTPLKQRFRRHCRETVRTGFEFGVYCVGSSIGLMLIFMVLGVMNITWMAVIAVLVTFQKLLPARAVIDVPLALAIVGLGIVILVAPSWIPGLTPAM